MNEIKKELQIKTNANIFGWKNGFWTSKEKPRFLLPSERLPKR